MNATSTQDSTTTTDSTTDSTPEQTFVKGTWQETLHKSSVLKDRGSKQTKQAGILLWTGAKEAVTDWLPSSDTDSSGENLYNEVKDALGAARKGDANKIKTVAVAVRDHGLVLAVHKNLSQAYGEAVRLTKTVQVQADEDNAAEKAIEALAGSVPHSTTTVEGAAALLLSKGIDGAVVAILDALGANNEAAHRAFMRSVSTEIAARVQAAKPKPAPKVPAVAKGTAQPSTGSSPKAAVKTAGTKAKAKAKPAAVKQSTKAKPVAVKQADKGAPVSAPVEAGAEPVGTPVVPVKQAATKAQPVKQPVVVVQR